MTDSDTESYSTAQKVLHWSIVVLVFQQYFVFDVMAAPFRETLDDGALVWTVTSVAHAAIGSVLSVLAVWRLALRLIEGAPLPVAREPHIAQKISKLAHGAFYILLLGLPVTGFGAWFLGNETMARAHEYGTTALLVVLCLHVAAVLVHQFWWKTDLLRRMS
ncbi:cytochrome b [Puniceibacterium sp. IMCC21224]|uniref:cytochrome b n=1 Tax=Puniceibacterium sp. IMCC21224 TaxID=1618204 RepID=UPI00065CDB6A|nr:cytochrome b/b6 domain-containing protein [Puniceibacterium sp. IMCC21224]KMK66160.1 cytochrome B561 [Puniceibacterium sp. IMCC21224]